MRAPTRENCCCCLCGNGLCMGVLDWLYVSRTPFDHIWCTRRTWWEKGATTGQARNWLKEVTEKTSPILGSKYGSAKPGARRLVVRRDEQDGSVKVAGVFMHSVCLYAPMSMEEAWNFSFM